MYDFKHNLKGHKPPKVKLNKRKQEKQPRDWRKLLHRLLRVSLFAGSAALAMAGAMLGVQLLRESDYFTVHNVRVVAQARVTEQEIAGASDVRIGASIFDLDLSLIGRKIEENPWIARAEVVRSLPDEVVITVTEHQPRAVIQLDYLYYVNDNGEVFKLLDSSDRLDYPIITGVDRQFLLDHAAEGQAWLRQALVLIERLEARQKFNLADVSEIRIDLHEGLVVHTRQHGVPVLFGQDDFDSKLDRLERIYTDLEPRLTALHYIDLNVADRVIVKVDPKYAAGRNEKQGRKGVS
ncbi:MAG: cell division protein FtsQ/DivIB [Desulfuromonadales bacterium]